MIQQQSQTVEWWKKTTVYHIYIRSFLDTNNDGIGDLQGIINKLDYIKDLGFESIWISPFTKSPQKDFGYDISDYKEISPLFGTMDLFDTLLKEVHNRGMKLILDLVLNHTSDEHEWFKESASSRNNPKADWYVWKDGKGKDGMQRPNNWRSMSGNWAWTYHPVRKQFYYTGFLDFQPDLNYDNPEVKQTMFDMVRFWLKKGVDGFRLDIISAIYEDPSLKNNPFSFRPFPSDKHLTIFFQHLKHNFLQERSYEFATELRAVVDEFPNKFIVGETHGDESIIHQFCKYKDKDGLNAIFLFNTLSTPFKAQAYYKLIEKFEKHFPEPLIPTYVFGNHDRSRRMRRLGNNIEKAKLSAFLQFTLRGIPFVYYGEEIGMTNQKIPLKMAQDPIGKRNSYVPQFIHDLSVESINRDECRTPMQWTNEQHAGFCKNNITPWLPIGKNYKTMNVEDELKDENSLLNFYKKMIHIRQENSTLNSGTLKLATAFCNDKILAYYRTTDTEKLLVILNFSNKKIETLLPNRKIILSTHQDTPKNILNKWEGRIYRL